MFHPSVLMPALPPKQCLAQLRAAPKKRSVLVAWCAHNTFGTAFVARFAHRRLLPLPKGSLCPKAKLKGKADVFVCSWVAVQVEMLAGPLAQQLSR